MILSVSLLMIVVKFMVVVVVVDEVFSLYLFGYGDAPVYLDRDVYVYLERLCFFGLGRCLSVWIWEGACLFE